MQQAKKKARKERKRRRNGNYSDAMVNESDFEGACVQTDRVFPTDFNKVRRARDDSALISSIANSNLDPVTIETCQPRRRPSIVPELKVELIPGYSSDSSSDEDSDEGNNKPKRGPNPKQLKKIMDKYNIHTCARNIMAQEKVVKANRYVDDSFE